jgi:hypothetical protein
LLVVLGAAKDLLVLERRLGWSASTIFGTGFDGIERIGTDTAFGVTQGNVEPREQL